MDHEDIAELTEEFWKVLDDSRVVMLAGIGTGNAPARPMTAQTDEDIKDGSVYFFASRSEGIGREVLAGTSQACFTFQSKDNGILASAMGPIAAVNDQAMIDKLWTPMAATYYDQGRSDPDLVLLRFTPPEFEVWRASTGGFLKAVAYKLIGKDAGQAHEEDRATIPA